MITRAVAEFLERHKREGVTEKLNRVYTLEESRVIRWIDPYAATG